jgi:hypothetical protein
MHVATNNHRALRVAGHDSDAAQRFVAALHCAYSLMVCAAESIPAMVSTVLLKVNIFPISCPRLLLRILN